MNEKPIRMLLVESVYSYPSGENNHPPLGLSYIASSLRKEFSGMLEFKIIRGNSAHEIKSFQPDVVGISSVSKNYNVAKGHAAVAKQANLPVIMGGIHISVLPQTLTHDMDVGIAGEGERTIIDVMSSFIQKGRFDKSELSQIEGVMYWDGDKVTVTKPRPLIRPIDDIPYPARDLLVIDKHTSMLSSRGCPYHCAFCSTAKYTGNQARYASAEYVADEIELIYKRYDVEYITICDDLFAASSKRVVRIVDLLRTKGLLGKLDFAVNIRTDFITDELAAVLHQMNVKAVGLGVESGCQDTLDYLKSGGITVEDNANAIRILRKHKIIPYCSIIIGSPYEDHKAMMQTVNFIKENKVEFMAINVLTPFPGTPVWDYAKSRGLVSDDMDWEKLFFNINYEPVILSEKMSRKEIFKVYTELANRKKRYDRRRQLLAIIKHPLKCMSQGLVKIKLIRGEKTKRYEHSPRS